MKRYLLASAVILGSITNANAAPLISASITGLSGAAWNTAVDATSTLFFAKPTTGVINPTDNFAPTAVTNGINSFLILGDGFPTNTTENSDAAYNLTLAFADGATITGQYVGSTFVNGTSATVNGVTYTLRGFGWDRSPVDNVSRFSANPGNDPADYTGQLSFSQVSAVPEATTWAMMIGGFGILGGTLRRRRSIGATATV